MGKAGFVKIIDGGGNVNRHRKKFSRCHGPVLAQERFQRGSGNLLDDKRDAAKGGLSYLFNIIHPGQMRGKTFFKGKKIPVGSFQGIPGRIVHLQKLNVYPAAGSYVPRVIDFYTVFQRMFIEDLITVQMEHGDAVPGNKENMLNIERSTLM